MKTINENQKWSMSLEATPTIEDQNPRPKIGDDDGITDRTMNAVIVLFTLITLCLSVASATANNDVKYRILLRQAMLDIDRQEYDKAVNKLLEVSSNTEENANVNHLLGKCYLYGNISAEKAVFYLTRAAVNTSADYEDWDLDETNAPNETFYLLAKAYEQTDHFDMAAQFYSQFLETLESELANSSSQTYAIISRSAEECRIAAAEQALEISEENIVMNK